LDVAHDSAVRSVGAAVSAESVEIVVTARGDAELEQWIFERKKGLFEEIFGIPVTLWCQGAGHDELDGALADGSGLG
ncbi:MAG: hypothetical protein ACRD0B_03440, partial [Acidimicrobiales bacterium]